MNESNATRTDLMDFPVGPVPKHSGKAYDLQLHLLKVPEVAEILGLGLTKTWALINTGSIPSIRIGRSRRVRHRDLEAWIDAQQ